MQQTNSEAVAGELTRLGSGHFGELLRLIPAVANLIDSDVIKSIFVPSNNALAISIGDDRLSFVGTRIGPIIVQNHLSREFSREKQAIVNINGYPIDLSHQGVSQMGVYRMVKVGQIVLILINSVITTQGSVERFIKFYTAITNEDDKRQHLMQELTELNERHGRKRDLIENTILTNPSILQQFTATITEPYRSIMSQLTNLNVDPYISGFRRMRRIRNNPAIYTDVDRAELIDLFRPYMEAGFNNTEILQQAILILKNGLKRF